ncbi:MAG: hypothetical protein Q6373_007865 [Candidatus Sigynarchaeota archaeon]
MDKIASFKDILDRLAFLRDAPFHKDDEAAKGDMAPRRVEDGDEKGLCERRPNAPQ